MNMNPAQSRQRTATRARVVHFTSGHTMPDIRVLQKECRSLAQGGYDVTLVARHPRDEVIDGVHIVAVSSTPKPPRLERLTKVVWKVYRTAAKQRAEIYHFHDPELLLAGLLLKLRGRKVIYDAHEAFTRKLRSKSWIPSRLRPLVAGFYGLLERQLCRTFDHVIAADVMTAQDLHASRVTVVANYPIIATKPRGGVRETPRDRFVLIYVGGLERDRGVGVMLDIAELLGDRVELRLLGRWFDPVHERRARGMANVTYLGFRPLDVVYEEMTNADLGLVLLQPVSAYLYAGENTNKIFEYMLCGLPVVASDFPAFQSFVTQVQCGICVDPTNAEKAAEEILRLLEKPDLREQMGRHGRSAVLAEYNWEAEKSKLLAVYEEVGGHPPAQPLAA